MFVIHLASVRAHCTIEPRETLVQVVRAIAAMAQVDRDERDSCGSLIDVPCTAIDTGGTAQPVVPFELIGACGVKRCVGRHVCFLPLTRVDMAKIGQSNEGGLSALDGGRHEETVAAEFEVIAPRAFFFTLLLYFCFSELF